jgi:hypothetical protein
MDSHLSSEDEMTPEVVVDNRKEPRSPCNGEIEIMTLGFFQRVFSGTLKDSSPSGLCILLKSELSEGTKVTAVIDDELIFGSVKYTVPVSEGFSTGIQIRYAIRRSHAA